jgi:hypothetical protein
MSINPVRFALPWGIVLALVVLSAGGCRVSGMLAQGGWVFSGDDVIVVQAEEAQTRREAFRRVLGTIERSELEVDRLQREVGYVRTRPERVDDTLDVRLNLVVTDSATVEIAGQYMDSRSREEAWRRVDWDGKLPRRSAAWTLMSEVAQAVGTVQGYEEDPLSYEETTCGGRRCEEEEVCHKNVCRAEPQRPSAELETAACTSSKEEALISQIHSYRAERGLPRIPVSTSLTQVARAHARDLARYEPHKETHFGKTQCTLHSWSVRGPWSTCCAEPDSDGTSCMQDKPKELSLYTGQGVEIAVQDVKSVEEALSAWASRQRDSSILENEGTWSGVEWQALGVGVFEGYAVAWFGSEPDSIGAPFSCSDGRSVR